MEDKVPVASHTNKRQLAFNQQNIITEGDVQMKQLVENQLNTHVTLKGQLAKVKHFTHGTVYKMPTDGVAGLVTPSEFHHLMEEGQHLDELRQFGLTENEIALKLQHNTDKNTQLKDNVGKSRYGADPLAYAEQITIIEQKIIEKEKQLQNPTTFSGAKPMTRHEMELEQAIAKDRTSCKLRRCLLTQKSLTNVDPLHPINHLESILRDILPQSFETKKHAKKRKRRGRRSDGTMDIGCSEAGVWFNPERCNTDLQSTTSQYSADLSNVDSPKCSMQKNDSSKSIKRDYDAVECIPVEVIEQYKLSEAQIRELPRFQNYNPGLPSKTLYLKNLSAKVTEADMVALFIRFQSSALQPILFKLLRGKMKGQAFITFDSKETATQALHLVNGYDFKGKPVIIEFGKKSIDYSENSG